MRTVQRRTAALVATALLVVLGTTSTGGAATAADDVLYDEDFADGLTGWTAVGGAPVTAWVAGSDTDNHWAEVDNRAAAAGSYVTPGSAVSLPDGFEASVQVRVDALGAGGNVSFVANVPETATRIQDGGTALQISGADAIRTAQPVTNTLCSGRGPVELGAQHTVTAQRWGGLIRFLVDGQQVAVHSAKGSGGTIALGAYRADATVTSVRVAALDAEPDGFPTSAVGCAWTAPTDPQPVLVNQSGYDLDLPKRFTAPLAEDGATFRVLDAAGTTVLSGTVTGKVGDFSDLRPGSTGPFRVEVDGEAGVGTSFEFGIGPDWTARVATEKSLRFLAGSLCWWGDFAKVGTGALASEATGPVDCRKAVAWRDASQYGFELTTLADLLEADPERVLAVPGDPALFTNAPHDLPDDAPLVAQLLYWGAEVYVREEVTEPQLKGQLASFLAAYPAVARWVPRDTYDRVRDYTFAHWSETPRDRFVWQAYTPDYDGNLLGVYTQVGTGKGELVPGHSILPNLRLHDVAVREGRDDAGVYLDAAVAQAAWIAENLDPADVRVTKGQRQSEWVLVTSLVRLAQDHPEATPDAVADFVSRWTDVVVDRSDNLWDFRKYDDSGTATDRWTIPPFTGGGQGEDPNEAGNVGGFAAPALAAASLLGDDDPRAGRLREIAAAHVDNVFGRNPTGRAAQYRVTDPDLAFEGLDKGWFSEYQGGYGILQGLPGVLDGSPKNGHYPYEPTLGNIGHTEGWVNVNTAFAESVAWLARTSATPASPVVVEVDARCLAGRAYVAVRASVPADTGAGAPVDVTLATDHGSRSGTVAPGANLYQAFSTRSAQVAAGTVRVTAAGVTTTHEHDAASCG